MSRFLASVTVAGLLLPISALALEGIGPRVTIEGVVEQVTVTSQNKFDEYGGELKVRARNGQLVTVILNKLTKIIAEGRISRKDILPENLQVGMDARVRSSGRISTDAINASLIVISNISLNPALSTSGIIQEVGETSVKVMGQNGVLGEYQLTNETEVSINYALRGMDALRLVGKEALITLNPQNPAQARIIRITGNKETTLLKPTTVQFGRRYQ